MRPGEGKNRDIAKDERLAVEKALRATGDVRSILDIGCGNGRWLQALSAKKPQILVALDLLQSVVAETRSAEGEPAERRVFVAADAGALPFASQSFDLVVCLQLMPFVRRNGRLRALREMRRVSGRWVIVEYAHVEGAAFFWQRLKQKLGLESEFPRNHLTEEEMESELRRAGLGIRGVAPVGGAWSRSWIVLAEAPSPDWMRA